jgi:hypothetical protein
VRVIFKFQILGDEPTIRRLRQIEGDQLIVVGEKMRNNNGIPGKVLVDGVPHAFRLKRDGSLNIDTSALKGGVHSIIVVTDNGKSAVSEFLIEFSEATTTTTFTTS